MHSLHQWFQIVQELRTFQNFGNQYNTLCYNHSEIQKVIRFPSANTSIRAAIMHYPVYIVEKRFIYNLHFL